MRKKLIKKICFSGIPFFAPALLLLFFYTSTLRNVREAKVASRNWGVWRTRWCTPDSVDLLIGHYVKYLRCWLRPQRDTVLPFLFTFWRIAKKKKGGWKFCQGRNTFQKKISLPSTIKENLFYPTGEMQCIRWEEKERPCLSILVVKTVHSVCRFYACCLHEYFTYIVVVEGSPTFFCHEKKIGLFLLRVLNNRRITTEFTVNTGIFFIRHVFFSGLNADFLFFSVVYACWMIGILETR